MKAQTNNDYYNILLQGCKEAFEVIELKEFLYTNEAMNDNKEIKLSDECIEYLGIEKSNNVIVDFRLQEAITIAFFKFLERQQVIFKKKYLIERNEFYKRCLNTININLTELNKKGNRPLRGIHDMGTPPDVLEFLEYMKWEIKDKSLQLNETPKAPQQIDTKNTDEVKHKKIAEKWHALLYWIELSANGQLLPIDNEGNFIKSEIEKIGKEKTGSKGQSFYKQFRLIDLNNSKELIGMFGNDWKEKIIHLSNNNQTIINYIELKFKQ